MYITEAYKYVQNTYHIQKERLKKKKSVNGIITSFVKLISLL